MEPEEFTKLSAKIGRSVNVKRRTFTMFSQCPICGRRDEFEKVSISPAGYVNYLKCSCGETSDISEQAEEQRQAAVRWLAFKKKAPSSLKSRI